MGNKFFGLKEMKIGENAAVFVDKESEAFLPDYLTLIQKNNPNKIFNKKVLVEKYRDKISLVLVTYNSQVWIDPLVNNIQDAADVIREIIVVDNGSTDDSIQSVQEKLPQAKVFLNNENQSLANGLNLGIQHANAEYLFIINPDITFSVDALLYLLEKESKVENKGIVAPKLLLMDNPQFLNGVGNFAGPFYWGYDCGLGHLDVGQFDDVETLFSACFAAVLIPRTLLETVGLIDEAYMMYYEDVDWCLRLRAKGFKIYLEPKAHVYHAYVGHQASKKTISSHKLKAVTYGRLRLIKKMALPENYIFLLLSYILYDVIYTSYSLIRFRFKNIAAIVGGWKKFLSENKTIQKPDSDTPINNLFGTPQQKFFPRIKNGSPVVTKKMIKRGKYL